jgi:hypothetical protein
MKPGQADYERATSHRFHATEKTQREDTKVEKSVRWIEIAGAVFLAVFALSVLAIRNGWL